MSPIPYSSHRSIVLLSVFLCIFVLAACVPPATPTPLPNVEEPVESPAEPEPLPEEIKFLQVINQSTDQIRRAVEIVQLYKIGFWDACIISNAEYANCLKIFSEDLNTGQFYSGIQVVNPFV